MVTESVLSEKSFKFALRIIKLSNYLKERKQFELSSQIMRAGTSIGALIREAAHAESRNDFVHKLNISLKEANETQYWLELMQQSNIITSIMLQSMKNDLLELIKMLISSIKTAKSNTPGKKS